MNFVTKGGSYTRVTGSAVTVLTSAACVLEGIFCAGVNTAQFVQLWDGKTTGTVVVGTCSLAANTFHEMPISFPNGLTYAVTNEDTDLTIFWRPLP